MGQQYGKMLAKTGPSDTPFLALGIGYWVLWILLNTFWCWDLSKIENFRSPFLHLVLDSWLSEYYTWIMVWHWLNLLIEYTVEQSASGSGILEGRVLQYSIVRGEVFWIIFWHGHRGQMTKELHILVVGIIQTTCRWFIVMNKASFLKENIIVEVFFSWEGGTGVIKLSY